MGCLLGGLVRVLCVCDGRHIFEETQVWDRRECMVCMVCERYSVPSGLAAEDVAVEQVGVHAPISARSITGLRRGRVWKGEGISGASL